MLAKPQSSLSAMGEKVRSWAFGVTRGTTVVTPHLRGDIITSPQQFKRLIRKLMKVEEFAFDTEFSSLRMQYSGEHEFVGCSFTWGRYNNYYVSVGSLVNPRSEQIDLEMFRKEVLPLFARTDVRIIGHNLKAELHALENIDVPVLTDDLFDTIVAVWNIDENNEVGLEHVTRRYYNYEQTGFKDLLQTIPQEVKNDFNAHKVKELNISMVDLYVVAPYAIDDSYWTWTIYLDIQDAMEDEGAETYFYKRQMPYLKILFNMERRGVRVDFDRLNNMAKLAAVDLEELEYKIYELSGIEFSITSGQQLAEMLFGWEKTKPIYEVTYEEIIDPKTGEQAVFKSGPRAGQYKWKTITNKDVIVGQEFSGNQQIVDNAFMLPMTPLTKKGQPKTGADELEDIAKKVYKRDKRKAEGVEMISLILRYKRLEKLRSTYMDGFANLVYSDGKIHASFNQLGTTSGRLSCSDPNLQQLPRALEDIGEEPTRDRYSSDKEYSEAVTGWRIEKVELDFWKRYEIRDALIPDVWINDKGVKAGEEDVIVALDYANLEVRILAHFSQDPLLIQMFQTGVDAHGDTAKNMFNLDCEANEVKFLFPHLRNQAKTINFMLLYGGAASTLARSLGIPKKDAQVLYDLYFATYKGVSKFMRSQKRVGHMQEYVQTILGRRRHLDGINGKDFMEVGYYERLSVNAPVQGSAADIAISAQIDIEYDEELISLGYRQTMQIHDEIVGICPRKNVDAVMKRKQYLMVNCLPFPLDNVELAADADWGNSYAEAK